MKLRAIAKVIIFNGYAYQTSQFNRNVYLGDPINICNIFSDQGCQELVLCFVRSAPSMKFVADLLSVCRSPVSVGGCGEKMEHFYEIVSNGAEKIILSDSLWDSSDKPKILSQRFGCQAIAASVDYIEYEGKRVVVTDNNRSKHLGLLEELLPQLELSLFGEIILNNISRDGQRVGLDYEILQSVQTVIKDLPIILSGGYNGENMIKDGISPDGFISGTHFSLFGKYDAALVYYPNRFSMNDI